MATEVEAIRSSSDSLSHSHNGRPIYISVLIALNEWAIPWISNWVSDIDGDFYRRWYIWYLFFLYTSFRVENIFLRETACQIISTASPALDGYWYSKWGKISFSLSHIFVHFSLRQSRRREKPISEKEGYPHPANGSAGAAFVAAFSLTDLKAVTKNLSSEFIVSESGEKATTVAYKRKLQNRRWIAIKNH